MHWLLFGYLCRFSRLNFIYARYYCTIIIFSCCFQVNLWYFNQLLLFLFRLFGNALIKLFLINFKIRIIYICIVTLLILLMFRNFTILFILIYIIAIYKIYLRIYVCCAIITILVIYLLLLLFCI